MSWEKSIAIKFIDEILPATNFSVEAVLVPTPGEEQEREEVVFSKDECW